MAEEAATGMGDTIEEIAIKEELPDDVDLHDPIQDNFSDGNSQELIPSQIDNEDENSEKPEPTTQDTARWFNRTCPSVLKGEPCWAKSKGKKCYYARHEAEDSEKQTHVYVCHLSTDMSSDDLEELFRPYGEIEECKILRHRDTKVSRGAGFVHFKEHKDAMASIKAMNGMELPNHDAPIECRFSKTTRDIRRADMRRGGRGRGGGFGRYGPPPRGYGRGPPPGWGPPPRSYWDDYGGGGGYGGYEGWGGYGPQRRSRGGGFGAPYGRGGGRRYGGGRGRGRGGPRW